VINPALIQGPNMQPGQMGPTQDALNGAYTGAFARLDPNASQPAPQYLGSSAIPLISQGPSIVSPSAVSPSIFGVGGPITIMGTPDSLGPASALSGQSTAGDAGVLSGMGVGQTIAPADSSVSATPMASDGSGANAAAGGTPTGGS
jgi:hypothetical protein